MVWLIFIGRFQILGFCFTLARLICDEWQQRRESKIALEAMESRPSRAEYVTWRTVTT